MKVGHVAVKIRYQVLGCQLAAPQTAPGRGIPVNRCENINLPFKRS